MINTAQARAIVDQTSWKLWVGPAYSSLFDGYRRRALRHPNKFQSAGRHRTILSRWIPQGPNNLRRSSASTLAHSDRNSRVDLRADLRPQTAACQHESGESRQPLATA